VHLVITDSGLGGLSICAGVDRTLRRSGGGLDLRITYVNAWPEEGRGYNDLPDMPARAAVFERALRRIDSMQPAMILIACNTLSILYELTEHGGRADVPVLGIIDAGVDLFEETLRARPTSSVVLVGTRTTIESGVHRERLLRRGISPGRVTSVSCHGLATAIEAAPRGPEVSARIDTCADRAGAAAAPGDLLYVGLCCTHYGMVADRLRSAVAQRTGRTVDTLDPNERLVSVVATRLLDRQLRLREPGGASRDVPIDVISKVTLADSKRRNVADVLEPISPATACALRSYRHVPDLF